MAVLKLFSYKLNYFVRYAYWLYNLSKADIGQGAKLKFPIIVEGKGNLIIGRNNSIEKNVEIGIGADALVALGNDNKLAKNVLIRIAPNKAFKTGEKVSINSNTQIYIHEDWELGNSVSIATSCSFLAREPGFYGKFSVGNGVSIGDNTIIDMSGDVSIGNDVALGPNCVIYTHDHSYKENTSIPWHGQPIVSPVRIGNGCWIGANVTILPGVTIGEGSIVATGAVVTKDVEAFTMVGGVPIKLLKKLV